MNRKGFIVILVLLSSVFAAGCQLPGQRPAWWLGFQDPAIAEQTKGLYTVDSYQPGKIPVVFVHGLLSDPSTWNEMISALSDDPIISSRYQFWLYRYPTGISYLTTASDLRSKLAAAVHKLDPDGQDPSLHRMVLVGHSMGGLLSKLQVTHSDDALWNAVSKKTFNQFQADPQTRADLQRVLFFEPHPNVARVVFIATPHAGSRWSQNSLGLLGARMVEFPERMRSKFAKIMQENQTALYDKKLTAIPTSVDHLSPDSRVMQTVRRLRFAGRVKLHSIIGVSPRLLRPARDDGVVTIESARLPNAESELVVRSSHTNIHRTPQTIQEVRRILYRHLSRIPR